MTKVQPVKDIDEFFKKNDPWGYETNSADADRKAILLSELDKLPVPRRVLDIGCGHGFVTRDLPGDEIIGMDISHKAIEQAQKLSSNNRIKYITCNIYDALSDSNLTHEKFDLIIITGVMYDQYIGESNITIYEIINELIDRNGFIVSVHIDSWYRSRFPQSLLRFFTYPYREYTHRLEVYKNL
jgi:2-polyprenyl-3-methyl-5-hydroxy-6-metoxy-1,4-benzoquinol methylase